MPISICEFIQNWKQVKNNEHRANHNTQQKDGHYTAIGFALWQGTKRTGVSGCGILFP